MSRIGQRDEASLLAYIDSYWEEYWTSPSYTQLLEFTGLRSKATIYYHLKRLVESGKLEERKQADVRRSVLYRRPA